MKTHTKLVAARRYDYCCTNCRTASVMARQEIREFCQRHSAFEATLIYLARFRWPLIDPIGPARDIHGPHP